MTFKELNFFYTLCETPHMVEVSKKLAVSQAAISLAIKSLEKKLEEPLFDRIGKKLVLNERGRFFKEETYSSFLQLQEAQTLFCREKLSGELKCACSKTIGGYIMPSIFFNFSKNYPKIKVEKSLSNSAKILEALKQGELDIGFVETEFEDPSLVKEELCSDELLVISNHQPKLKEVYIDQILQKDWVLRESGSGTKEMFLYGLGDLAKELNVVMEFGDFEEIKNLFGKQENIFTCISSHAIKEELNDKKIYAINIKNIQFKRKFYCVYHKKKVNTKVFEIFKSFVFKRVSTLLS